MSVCGACNTEVPPDERVYELCRGTICQSEVELCHDCLRRLLLMIKPQKVEFVRPCGDAHA